MKARAETMGRRHVDRRYEGTLPPASFGELNRFRRSRTGWPTQHGQGPLRG